MIAITTGTTSWRQADNFGANEVEFVGEFLYEPDGVTPAMVWDDAIQNVRPRTDVEQQVIGAAQMWERVKAERDRRIQEQGYVVADKRFHGDTFSRTQQMGLVMLGANIPPGLQWKTMDGSFVTMTPTLAQQIFGAAAASDIALFGYAEQLRARVNAAQDPSSVDIFAGWPE